MIDYYPTCPFTRTWSVSLLGLIDKIDHKYLIPFAIKLRAIIEWILTA